MIVLDANVFLRMLATPGTPQDARRAAAARALFQSIEDRAVEAATNDAIVAEVAFVLTSSRHYALPRPRAAAILAQLLRLPNLAMSAKPACLSALRIWTEHPNLDFPDALAIAQARATGAHLASFDGDVRRLAGVPLWEANPPADQPSGLDSGRA